MTEPRAKVRPVGATAVLGRTGFPHITSASGGELSIVTGATQPGFNPLDLLYASLAGCLAMSARIVASEMGVMENITEIGVAVTGEKAATAPSRVARFDAHFAINGDIDADTKAAIASRAEHEVCTVSNTIRSNPEFSVTTV